MAITVYPCVSAGMALGIDRLVMILTSREDVRDVLALAWDEL